MRYRQMLPVLLIIVSLIQCKKFVQIDPPISRLVTSSVFNNSASATSALTSIYSKMQQQTESYNISKVTGLLGDEMINYAGSGSNLLYYTNSMTSISNLGPWQTFYNYIYQANAIIEGLEKDKTIYGTISQQIEGECRFIRAFCHFYLVNLYGDIPIVTTTDYSINSNAFRAKKSVVYDQITWDLRQAANLLSEKYVDQTDTTLTVERIRPNEYAARSLLSRVYLYVGKYDSARIESTKVIEQSQLYRVEASLGNVFLKNSKEAIWQLSIPTPNLTNTADGQLYILSAAPGEYDISLAKSLIDAFENGDARKSNWIGYFAASSPVDTFYYPFKYKIKSSTTISEYTMVLRLAEQYLIRAESLVELNNVQGGIDDLNVIRNRAGLANYVGATDKNSILSAILHERQVEFFAEWGHRWLDINRTGAVDTILGAPGDVCKRKGGIWNLDRHQILFPIWQSEISNDRNLSQNPGY